LYEGQLYKLGPNNILRQCLIFEEMAKVLADFHERHVGGHLCINTIVRKILASSYWWPKLSKDAAKMCQTCDIRQ
jgi:hypothetical protein